MNKIKQIFLGERNSTFDLLKLYATLSVIMDHMLQKFIGGGIQQTAFYDWIYISQMPIFFFVSGFFMFKNLERNFTARKWGIKFITTIVSFLIPFITYSIFSSLIALKPEGIFSKIGSSFLYPYNSLWFLWALLLIEILMMLSQTLAKLVKSQNILANLTINLIAFMIFLIPFIAIWLKNSSFYGGYLVAYYSIFVLFGYLFHFFQSRLHWINKNITKFISFFLSLLSIFLIVFIRNKYSFDSGSILNICLRLIGGIFSIILMLSLFSLISKYKPFEFLSKFGRLSLEFYYVHYLIAYTNPWLNITCDVTNALGVLEFIGLYLAVVLVSFVVIMLLKTNFVTDFIFFGKLPKFKKKEIVEAK